MLNLEIVLFLFIHSSSCLFLQTQQINLSFNNYIFSYFTYCSDVTLGGGLLPVML